MLIRYLTFLLFLLGIISTKNCNGAKILFLSIGGNWSQKMTVWPYVLALAEKQHNITFISSHTKSPKPHPNIKEITSESLIQVTRSTYEVDRFKEREQGGASTISIVIYGTVSINCCKAQLEDPTVQTIIQKARQGEEKFDLIIANAIFGECGILIAKYLQTPFILFDTSTIPTWYYSEFGIPWQTNLIPDMTLAFENYPLSFWERLLNFWTYFKFDSRADPFTNEIEAIKTKYFKDAGEEFHKQSYIEMQADASLVFLGVDPTFDFARPLPPNFKYVGGMQCDEKLAELPKLFKEFMDGASEDYGVILIAFGSTIPLNKLPPYYLNIFLNMMRKFDKVRFIWRWSGPPPENMPVNLLSSDWVPQKEILNHPKLRAFMTHGGAGSISEATCYGVPLIAVPLFADQDLNAYRIFAHEVGLKVDIQGLSQAKMDSIINEILTNPKFKENALTRAKILKDQPMKPVETAVWWTEFVLRHKDLTALKPTGLDQPLFIRNMFDIFLVIIGLLICAPVALLCIISWIVKRCTSIS